jgi:ribonuclease HI
VECSLAQTFWKTLKDLEGVKLPKIRSLTWPEDLLDDSQCKEENRVVILCGMWSLWNSRNDLYHGKKPIEHKLAIDWALDACYHLLLSQGHQTKQVVRSEKWRPPPVGTVKLNCDGGFHADVMRGSVGTVLRDHNGAFICASERWIPAGVSALVMEAEACRDGLWLLTNISESNIVIMESDSLQLVSLWNMRRSQRSEVAVLLEMENLVSSFSSFSFVHVKRSANGAAHHCAKHAAENRSSGVWFDQPLSFLLSSIQSDCNTSVV